jgi:hypothetical protein
MRKLAFFCLALWAGACQAQFSEAEVKAAFLYNFARFVEWPKGREPGRELVIGVLGTREVEGELRRIAADRTQDRRMRVRAIDNGASLDGVHILYLGSGEQAGPGIIAEARQRHILVVSDAPDGLARGAAINFVTTDRVRFEVSLKAAEEAGLRLSSRLLSVAMRIRKGEAPGDPTIRLHA